MIVNINNPIPILQQKPSFITTNTLIPFKSQPQIQESRLQESKLQESKLQESKLNIHQQISSDFIEFFNNMLEKPNDTPWSKYIIESISKKKRYTYIGLFFILIAIYMLILRN